MTYSPLYQYYAARDAEAKQDAQGINRRSELLEKSASGQVLSRDELLQADAERTGFLKEARKGLRRFGYNALATTRATGAQILENFDRELAAQQFAEAQRTLREMPASAQPRYATFDEAREAGVGGVIDYAGGVLGQGLPTVATAVAGGLLTRGGARALGAGSAARDVAQYAGGAATAFPMEAGETALSLRDSQQAMDNTTPLERTGLVLGRGAVNAALESVVPQATLANAIRGAGGRIASGARPALSSVGRYVAGGTLGEAATEAAQELTGQAAMNIAAPGTGYDLGKAREAAIAGGIVGGVTGGLGGVTNAAISNVANRAEATQRQMGPNARRMLNSIIKGVDDIAANPEQFGFEAGTATLEAMTKAAATATEKSGEARRFAGRSLATGMDAIADLGQRLDQAIAPNIDPENIDSYARLVANLHLLNPAEYQTIQSALRGEVDDPVGTIAYVATEFGRRNGEALLDAAPNIARAIGGFTQGITRAYQQRAAETTEKAAFSTLTDKEVKAEQTLVRRLFKSNLMDDQSVRVFEALPERTREELVQGLVLLANEPQLPGRDEIIASTQTDTGIDVRTALDWIPMMRGDSEEARVEGVSKTGRIAEDNELYDPLGYGRGVSEEKDDNFGEVVAVYDELGNKYTEEDPRTTPFNLENFRASMDNRGELNEENELIKDYSKYGNNPNAKFTTSIPTELRSETLSPRQLAALLGNKFKKGDDRNYFLPVSEEGLARLSPEPGQPLKVRLNSAALGSVASREATREAFAPFVEEINERFGDTRLLSTRDKNILSGERAFASLTALMEGGIDISIPGTDEQASLGNHHIDVQILDKDGNPGLNLPDNLLLSPRKGKPYLVRDHIRNLETFQYQDDPLSGHFSALQYDISTGEKDIEDAREIVETLETLTKRLEAEELSPESLSLEAMRSERAEAEVRLTALENLHDGVIADEAERRQHEADMVAALEEVGKLDELIDQLETTGLEIAPSDINETTADKLAGWAASIKERLAQRETDEAQAGVSSKGDLDEDTTELGKMIAGAQAKGEEIARREWMAITSTAQSLSNLFKDIDVQVQNDPKAKVFWNRPTQEGLSKEKQAARKKEAKKPGNVRKAAEAALQGQKTLTGLERFKKRVEEHEVLSDVQKKTLLAKADERTPEVSALLLERYKSSAKELKPRQLSAAVAKYDKFKQDIEANNATSPEAKQTLIKLEALNSENKRRKDELTKQKRNTAARFRRQLDKTDTLEGLVKVAEAIAADTALSETQKQNFAVLIQEKQETDGLYEMVGYDQLIEADEAAFAEMMASGGPTAAPAPASGGPTSPPPAPPAPPSSGDGTGGDGTPPTPREFTEDQKKFLNTVRKIMGTRVAVVFGSRLDEGIGATYTAVKSVDEALLELREQRTELIKQARQDRTQVDPEILRDIIRREKVLLEDKAVLGMIRVANGMEVKGGLAEHEALHAAFSIFLTSDERAALATAATQGIAGAKLREFYSNSPDVLAVIDPINVSTYKPEEAAAYMFQAYAMDPLAIPLGRGSKTIFDKFVDFMRSLFNILTPEQKAQMLMDDLLSGRRAESRYSSLHARLDEQRSLTDEMKGLAVAVGDGVGKLSDIVLKPAYKRLVDSENPALAQIARLGYQPTGERGDPGYIQRNRQQNNLWEQRINDVFRNLTEEQAQELHDFMIAGGEGQPSADSEVITAHRALLKLYRDGLDYRREAGVDIGDRGENYYPLNWDAEKVAADREGFIRMLEKYPETRELAQTPNQIWENIAGYITRGEQLQSVLGSNAEPVTDSSLRMTLNFISREDRREFMNDDPVATASHYFQQAVREAEYVRAYGAGGARLSNMLAEARQVYGATPEEIALAQDYIDGLLGQKEINMNRNLKDAYGALAVYQHYRLLPFAAFSSFVDPLGIGVRTEDTGAVFDAFKYQIKNLFRDWQSEYTPDQMEILAQDLGVIDSFNSVVSLDKRFSGITLTGRTKQLNDKLFKANLLNGMVRNTHISATNAAMRYMFRLKDGLFGPEKTERWADELQLNMDYIIPTEDNSRIRVYEEEFVDAGLNPEQAAEAAAHVREKINTIVSQSLITPSSPEMPNWMSNPLLAPIAALKQFVFGFNATLYDRVIHEARNGNYTPAYYAAMLVPGMIASDLVRDFVTNFGDEPEWKRDWGLSDHVMYGVQRSGLYGRTQFFGDAAGDAERGGLGIESALGPAFGQAAKAAQIDDGTDLWRNAVKAMPLNAVYDQWVL